MTSKEALPNLCAQHTNNQNMPSLLTCCDPTARDKGVARESRVTLAQRQVVCDIASGVRSAHTGTWVNTMLKTVVDRMEF